MLTAVHSPTNSRGEPPLTYGQEQGTALSDPQAPCSTDPSLLQSPAGAQFPLREMWNVLRAELDSSPIPAQTLPEAVLAVQSKVCLLLNHSNCQSIISICMNRIQTEALGTYLTELQSES